MSGLKLLVCGLLSEQLALVAIFGSQPVWQRFSLFFVSHLIASALFAMLLTISFPKRFTTNRNGLLGLFFCFNFFVPALGAVGTLLILIYFRKFLKDSERTEFFSVPLPPFLAESADLGAGMGEGGAWSRLRSVELPRELRLKALMSVGTGSGTNTSRFLQHATGDSDDEIRLLAFNLYERQEQKIQQTISAELDALKRAELPPVKAAICRNLAFSYWEMVYSALAQDDLRDFFMVQAIKYAEQARQYGGDDPSLFILLTRIHLLKQEFAQAASALQSALAAGVDPLKVVPYQAELAYHDRDFGVVKRLLLQDATIRFRPYIGQVAQFWGGRL